MNAYALNLSALVANQVYEGLFPNVANVLHVAVFIVFHPCDFADFLAVVVVNGDWATDECASGSLKFFVYIVAVVFADCSAFKGYAFDADFLVSHVMLDLEVGA